MLADRRANLARAWESSPWAAAANSLAAETFLGGDSVPASHGLFIAKEVGGDSVDLIKLFDLHTRVVFESAVRLLQSGEDL